MVLLMLSPNDLSRVLWHLAQRLVPTTATFYRFNTIYHGQFCVNETVHVMANSDAYLWDANAPAAYESGLCWGCKNDADRGVSPAQYNM